MSPLQKWFQIATTMSACPKGYGWVSDGTFNGQHWNFYQPDKDIGTDNNLVKVRG